MLHDVLEDTAVAVADIREAGVTPEVIEAVIALTHHRDQTYDEYIEQVAGNVIACQVKVADLADNLANNRRLDRTADVIDRMERYEPALQRLNASMPEVNRLSEPVPRAVPLQHGV